MEATNAIYPSVTLDVSWPVRFSATGFCKVPQLFDDAALSALDAETEQLLCQEGYHKIGCDDGGRPVVVNYADKQSDFLFEVSRSRRLVDLVEHLLGERVVPLHVEIFEKPAGSAAIAAPHQDHAFYHKHFGQTEAIAIWLALDDVTELSGGLEYATTFGRVLLPHGPSPAVLAAAELSDGRGLQFALAPLQRGDAVAHSSYLVHRSGPNLSNARRRGIAFNYRCSPYRSRLDVQTGHL